MSILPFGDAKAHGPAEIFEAVDGCCGRRDAVPDCGAHVVGGGAGIEPFSNQIDVIGDAPRIDVADASHAGQLVGQVFDRERRPALIIN